MVALVLLASGLVLTVADSTKSSTTPVPSTASGTTKKTSHSSQVPGLIPVHQDIDLEADADCQVRILQPTKSANEEPSATQSDSDEIFTNSNLEKLPGRPGDFHTLHSGQPVKVVLWPRAINTSQSAGKKAEKVTKRAVENQLTGTLYHVDPKHRKFTVRVDFMALQGTVRRQTISKKHLKEILADYRVKMVLILAEVPAPK
jgi:hypothetical protein